MEVFWAAVLLLLGFYILVKGASLLVRGAIAIAKLFRVSTWFVGAAIVSFGTTTPELSVSLVAAFDHSPVGIATVFGSNMFNLLAILGVATLITPVVVRRNWAKIDFPFYIAITILTGAMLLFPVLGDPTFVGISRPEGAVLLGVLVAWLVVLFRAKTREREEPDIGAITVFAALFMMVFGFIGIFLGGQWVVHSAQTLAKAMGVSESVIGLTLVALGTSLPEMAVSVTALIKGSRGIAVGNVLGASIFNLLGVLGITALVHPVVLHVSVMPELLAVLGVGIILTASMYIGKRYTLTRTKGFVFLSLYIIYVLYLYAG